MLGVSCSKPGKGSATVNQLEDLPARIGDVDVLSRGACIRKAYALIRCPPPLRISSDLIIPYVPSIVFLTTPLMGFD